jgi:hypothetical protein
MQPATRADLTQACRAISDLASLRFAIEDVAAKMVGHEFDDAVNLWNAMVDYGGELLAAIGKPTVTP